jgi:hypothetical protein
MVRLPMVRTLKNNPTPVFTEKAQILSVDAGLPETTNTTDQILN